MAIVLTLRGKAIKNQMIITELGMAKLKDGERLHVLPKLAEDLLALYPDNIVKEGDFIDVSPWPEGARYLIVEASDAPAKEDAKEVVEKKLKGRRKAAEAKTAEAAVDAES